VGASLSVTVTVNEQLAVSEAPSVTVRVTVVTPVLKICVPGCPLPTISVAPVVLQAKEGLLQLSPKVMAGMVTLAVHAEASVFTDMFEGQVTEGASSSVTVTVKLQLAVFAGEAPSETSTETVVSPVLKTAPFSVAFIVPVVAPESV
jgi:hypothetical protein